MGSRTAPHAFAEVAIRLEGQNEQPRPATYRETAAAIVMALAESGQEHDPSDEDLWDCEIELLEECDEALADAPNMIISTKH